jgi:hypothetical protein
MATILDESIGRGGYGLGLGGGSDGGGGVLLGLLLGRGLLGENNRDRDRDCVTQSDLNGKAIGDLKGEIKDAESTLQLALAGNQAAITQLVASVGNQIQNGQTAQLLQTCNQTATLSAAIAAVDTNVDRQACDIKSAIHADGEATRALITSNQIAELNQRLTVAQLENAENRAINREQSNSHNVTTTVNTNQQQAQLQTQELRFTLNQLLGVVGGLSSQVARATNSNVIVGNTGASTTGAQTASPTNVNA